MTFEIIAGRIDQLKGEWCDFGTIKAIYGIDFGSESDIKKKFCDWVNSFEKKRDCFLEKKVNRWLFELFLQKNDLMTTKQAAISLAMGREDFEKIIFQMIAKEMIFKSYEAKLRNSVIDKAIVNNLSKCFPSLQFTLFTDRFVYIKILHDTVKKELEIEINPIFPCFAEKNTEYATDYDILTDEPMASHNGVWLDFHKPFSLKPDICSIYTYCKNQGDIDQFLFSDVDEQDIVNARKKLTGNDEYARFYITANR